MSYCTLHICYAELQTYTDRYRSMSPARTSRVVYGRITRRPSFEGAAARLNDCLARLGRYVLDMGCTETETDKGGPCASLEEEDREDDAEGDSETRADEH
ncbi:hypothetical protein BM1_08948 [Bipolaris maydis]|nr:hypothetical protein BM1_08948 [Bipolaris maydis]